MAGNRVTIPIIIFAIILIGVAYFLGTLQSPQTTATITLTTTVTTTFIPPRPAQITVSGDVSTNTAGTFPASIRFISSTTGISYPGQITNGNYNAMLPNPDVYLVRIHWIGIASIQGDCDAGSIIIFVQFQNTTSIVSNWSC